MIIQSRTQRTKKHTDTGSTNKSKLAQLSPFLMLDWSIIGHRQSKEALLCLYNRIVCGRVHWTFPIGHRVKCVWVKIEATLRHDPCFHFTLVGTQSTTINTKLKIRILRILIFDMLHLSSRCWIFLEKYYIFAGWEWFWNRDQNHSFWRRDGNMQQEIREAHAIWFD